MVKENEVVMLLLCCGVAVFMVLSRRQVVRITKWKILLGAYGAFFVGALCTVCEGFMFESLVNALEHVSYLVSTLLLVMWVWRVLIQKEGAA